MSEVRRAASEEAPRGDTCRNECLAAIDFRIVKLFGRFSNLAGRSRFLAARRGPSVPSSTGTPCRELLHGDHPCCYM
ncbi:hypothetical protein Y032_0053g2343 [Ancylostoma ceylanicum]|uniref:Uncharacterized protein n=1 Tax=Ancylostoma ceylanicum TaxID=53326 RepID=A0A016U7F8_9BILA|nr:hypothetical protein Y032_0053g2343 [Ancylostoma ceylanicum]